MSPSTSPSRRDFLKTAAGAGIVLAHASANNAQAAAPNNKGMTLAVAPKMETVRVGLIGVGARGGGHLGTLLTLEGVQITAIADNHEPSLSKALARVKKAERPAPATFGKGDKDYKNLLEREDVDIVIIATPWSWHTVMCVDAMNAGKHAFTEVPAAVTVEECWQLVDTSEKTGKLCMMLENVNYGREELFCLNICRLGLLGDLLHAEAAYIHELRGQMNSVAHGTGSWRTFEYANRNGNLYPTHGLGPVAQYMNINRGDRFDYMTSMSSPALGRQLYAEDNFPADHQWNKIKNWKCGDMNTSIIKTALGRTIMLQWDETSPRPYSRHNLIQGTRGTFAGFPNRLALEGVTPDTHKWTQDADLKEIMTKYEHPLYTRMGKEAKKNGGHGGMDWLMLWRIVYCLRNGEALDQSVYDAAAWSAVGPLSEKSITQRSASVDVPDFTRGRWKTTPPLPIVT